MKNSLLLFILSILSLSTFAQGDIPVGTWRTHNSYNNVIDIALGDDAIYAATSNALFVYDQTDNSIQTITKLDGLSGSNISSIAYSQNTTTLIIGYDDGNIDLVNKNVITNIDLIQKDDFTQEKTINNIFIANNLAYLAADFGVSILDVGNKQLKETIVNLGPNKINQVAIANDSLYAATSAGVMATTLDPTVNILDFNNWKTFTAPSTEISNIINSNNTLLIAEKNGSLYRYDNGNWVKESVLQNKNFVSLSNTNIGVTIVTETNTWTYENGVLEKVVSDASQVNRAIKDNGNIWIADQSKGLLKVNSGNSESILPSGPSSNIAFTSYNNGDDLLVLSGGYDSDVSPLNIANGFYQFKTSDGWTNYNSNGTGIEVPVVSDLVGATFNTAKDQLVLNSIQNGLLVVNADNSSTVINQSSTGSTLTSNMITDVAYANEGIWMLNYRASRPIHHWKDDGTWESFALSTIAARSSLQILVAENNDKWLRISPTAGGGLYVFNEETGKQRYLINTANNGGLPSSTVNTMSSDLNRQIWVGTSRGVAYYPGSFAIEDNNAVDAILPRVDFVPLLRDENVLSIAVDGGNRKWIGTENGVWLFSEDGDREISFFNTQNSPLPSNRVLSISILPNSGEVFFITDQGVVSYRGTATEAESVHQEVKIFPNPITRDFNGLVGISGLAQNAIVKITDVSGKLIRQMKANGGTATWNVRDYRGNRAATGVYLVFSATEDGEDSLVGKLAVVN